MIKLLMNAMPTGAVPIRNDHPVIPSLLVERALRVDESDTGIRLFLYISRTRREILERDGRVYSLM